MASSSYPSGRRRRPVRGPASVARRRRLAALLLFMAPAGFVAGRQCSPSDATVAARVSPGVLELVAGDRVLARLPAARDVSAGRTGAERLEAAVRRAVPGVATTRRGLVSITYGFDLGAAVRRGLRLGSRGGTVHVRRRALSTRVAAPVRRQQQANTCEAAALSVLLATRGRAISEPRLQGAMPTSGPLDPQGAGASRVWGDPDRGYVGRPDGGGVAGGFGVYPRPVIAAAARFGERLEDLSGRPPEAIYRALLAGHAVMAWVGLSAGPYGAWRSPQGRRIAVNFGEHTVVLHGIRADGSVLVSNPLRGTRETWSSGTFERRWELLGRRAVAA